MDKEYLDFIKKINAQIGVDLSCYKEAQMRRRLNSLASKHGCQSLAEFYMKIYQNESLLEELLDRITINVSSFFRNLKQWHVLQQTILPELFNRYEKLDVWSAACSSGEEPFTLLMMLFEMNQIHRVRLVATDLDEKALAKAKRGIFTKASMQEIPDYYKNKYFTEQNGRFVFAPELRKKVTFYRHDLLKDPPPSRFHLILCRNVVIYFTEDAKHTLYRKLGESLVDEGILFVGGTEQIFRPEIYFLRTRETFFYQKKIISR